MALVRGAGQSGLVVVVLLALAAGIGHAGQIEIGVVIVGDSGAVGQCDPLQQVMVVFEAQHAALCIGHGRDRLLRVVNKCDVVQRIAGVADRDQIAVQIELALFAVRHA